jgi:hypothetical protein
MHVGFQPGVVIPLDCKQFGPWVMPGKTEVPEIRRVPRIHPGLAWWVALKSMHCDGGGGNRGEHVVAHPMRLRSASMKARIRAAFTP